MICTATVITMSAVLHVSINKLYLQNTVYMNVYPLTCGITLSRFNLNMFIPFDVQFILIMSMLIC